MSSADKFRSATNKSKILKLHIIDFSPSQKKQKTIVPFSLPNASLKCISKVYLKLPLLYEPPSSLLSSFFSSSFIFVLLIGNFILHWFIGFLFHSSFSSSFSVSRYYTSSSYCFLFLSMAFTSLPLSLLLTNSFIIVLNFLLSTALLVITFF